MLIIFLLNGCKEFLQGITLSSIYCRKSIKKNTIWRYVLSLDYRVFELFFLLVMFLLINLYFLWITWFRSNFDLLLNFLIFTLISTLNCLIYHWDRSNRLWSLLFISSCRLYFVFIIYYFTIIIDFIIINWFHKITCIWFIKTIVWVVLFLTSLIID